jgi:hypothetical protein
MSFKVYSYRQDSQTFPQYFSIITLLHAALSLGQIIFAAVVIFLRQSDSYTEEVDLSLSKTSLQFLIAMLLLIGFVAGRLIFKNRLSKLTESDTLSAKLSLFRAVSIQKYALEEFPILVSIGAYLMTGEIVFIGLAGLGTLTFILDRPTKNILIEALMLSQKEIAAIENPDTIVVKETEQS